MRWIERHATALLLLVAGVVWVVSLVAAVHDPTTWTEQQSVHVVTFALCIILGEQLPLRMDSQRASAPVSSSMALAFAFTAQVPGENLNYGAGLVVAVSGAAFAVGHLPAMVARRRIDPGLAARFYAVVTVAFLWRHVTGEPVGSAVRLVEPIPWLRAIDMLAVSFVGLVASAIARSLIIAGREGAPTQVVLLRAVQIDGTLPAAMGATGVLIALGAPALGLISLVLFALPLAFAFNAARRYEQERRILRQASLALSRMTEPGGYTALGHTHRVAQLAVQTGSLLGLPKRRLQVLEQAALLHDVGQVALAEPIPGGATTLAAPADQRRIVADTLRIVRRSASSPELVAVLESQVVPYRFVVEHDAQIPVESRILKAANAFDDHSRGFRGAEHVERALERLHLGLGYRYDPRVVEALEQVVRASPPTGCLDDCPGGSGHGTTDAPPAATPSL